jgi:hypothetical protein
MDFESAGNQAPGYPAASIHYAKNLLFTALKPSKLIPPQRASALIVCLCMIILVTGVVIAFFSQVQFSRDIEASGAARTKAEILARSGLDYTTSLLIREIVDPGNSLASEGSYRPIGPANYRPKIQLKAAADDIRRLHVPGLIKQSISEFDPMTSSVGTGDFDGRKRWLGPSRWNAPYFYYSVPQFTTAQQAPDWIYFSAEGPTKEVPALGRIAFNIYRLDGLLDLNVAGFPSTINGNLAGINQLKATVAGANIGRVSRVGSFLNQTFVDLRSRKSARDGSYLERMLVNRDGFRLTPPGDTQFVSRLDLVRYALTNNFNNNSLAFVTTWSRSLDAPSWIPPRTAANSFAPAVRRTSDADITDYHVDGSTLTHRRRAGSPVAPRRFPLNRLRFFLMSDSTTRAKIIRQYFGLENTGPSRWRYVDDHIRTLTELRSVGREPNFFEMLKAAIESPSLGKAQAGQFALGTAERDRDADLQLLQIGASIIDAAMAGNSPTVITMDPNRYVCGIKDLPYLYGLRFRQVLKTNDVGTIEQIDLFAVPILVNPHAPVEADNERPPVRIRWIGKVTNAQASVGGTGAVVLEPRIAAGSEERRVIPIDPSAFRRVSPIQKSTAKVPASNLMPGYWQGDNLAFWLASGVGGMPIPPATAGSLAGVAHLLDCNVVAEYWNGVNWVVYDALVGDGQNDPPNGLGPSVPMTFASTRGPNRAPDNDSFRGPETVYLLKPDPRTTRWGPAMGRTESKPHEIPSDVVSPFGIPLALAGTYPPVPDPDRTRENDLQISGKTANALLTSLEPDELRARSRILHQLPRTVADLGLCHRGDPWKTLDFATDGSADAALLDFFTINETPPDGVVAGRISLNLSLPEILDSQLAFTAVEAGSTTVLSDSRVRQIADAVGAANLQSPADLVGLIGNSQGTKEQREAHVRALGTAGQTRTWNFFIDLIAQVGRFPAANPNGLAGFIPQGESRLWMHVAIDRYTAEVIDTYIETYQE